MASVPSLDADMRNLRLSRYTPHAASEARAWIESTLGRKLAPGDLLEVLKDGVALCELANRAIQPQLGAIKFKASAMPFIQMENISHFLRACESAPLSLPAHDRFLTVDLYEQKDPAQVLQCLAAFSRRAHQIQPAKFPSTIGAARAPGSGLSPTHTGGSAAALNGSEGARRPASPVKYSASTTGRSLSPVATGGSNSSSQKGGYSAGPVSSWSNRSDEGVTAPAWNIHQYGYMGGASQGNQGISFGARRQITNQAPLVPSLAEKEKLRREKEAEAERARQEEAEEREQRRRAMEEEEARARAEEERHWAAETERLREEERRRLDAQKREWEEQERRWKQEEEARQREDAALQASMAKKPPPPEKPRVPSSSILRGQTLSEWQKEQAGLAKNPDGAGETPEQKRVRELERQLEEARERERQYQREREERLKKTDLEGRARTEMDHSSRIERDRSRTRVDRDPPSRSDASAPASTAVPPSAQDRSRTLEDERDDLRQQWQSSQAPPQPAAVSSQRPLPVAPNVGSSLPRRPLPEPTPNRSNFESAAPPPPSSGIHDSAEQARTQRPNRTDAFLAQHTAPTQPGPRISGSREAGDTAQEQSTLRDSRMAGQQKTQAGGWASKSLLEREMERERERQREWQANQEALKDAPRDPAQGSGEGQSWDVNQYGYIGGDGMNKGSSVGSGINIGGRRQIIGPRPRPP